VELARESHFSSLVIVVGFSGVTRVDVRTVKLANFPPNRGDINYAVKTFFLANLSWVLAVWLSMFWAIEEILINQK
jgi:hypothetical protein